MKAINNFPKKLPEFNPSKPAKNPPTIAPAVDNHMVKRKVMKKENKKKEEKNGRE